ncbi:calcium-binding protein [Jannaschia formosa]|uniref:calcium-binding protein n=1 Tax=Jannaschia formosa TaxID=2259592 RepID=UPI000E1B9723|nr:calcium-binding protein [Jannaschia formosa]TFL19261.1 hypothetical protein DR046_04870 [Jannaschia formosa]
MAEIIGTPNDDRGGARLDGTPQDDRIEGRAGDDELFGQGGSDSLFGGSGNDTLVSGPSGNGIERLDPGTGSDRVDLRGITSFAELFYLDAPTALDVVLDEGGDFARVIEGDGSVDSYLGFGRLAREFGLYFGGSAQADTYRLQATDRSSYIHVDVGDGNDTVTLVGGEGTIRLGVFDNGPDGVAVNLLTARIDSGTGGIDRLIFEGDPRRLQVQAGETDDLFVGGNGRLEEWVWRGGDDTVDGGGRAITSLSLRARAVSDAVVDLEQGTATARWEGQAYTLTLNDVEQVIGSDAAGDVLRGDDGANYLEGNGGNDTLEGRGGNDELVGGDGDDRLVAGGGTANRLRGDDGDDTLISGSGSDNIGGGDGNDRIDLTEMTGGFGGFIMPGLGRDRIIGSQRLWETGEGHDLSYEDLGGVGGMVIEVGAEGTGTARSGDGRVDDRFSFTHFFIGSADDDRITSLDEAAGTFRFEGFRGDAGNDTIAGGANGFDILDYRAERFTNDNVRAVTVNMGTGVAIDTFGDRDSFSGIESVRGTALADRFIGTANQEFASFRGYAGADRIEGAALVARADGTLFGVETADYSDDIRDGGTGGIDVDLAAGTGRDGFGDVDVLIEVDGVRGTNVDDVIRGSDTFNDLRGRGGNDRLEGRGGNDLLIGEDGDDTLDGGAGDDTLEGGAGSDLYIVDSGDVVVERAGDAGFDEVRSSRDFALGEGIERLTATGTRDIRLDGTRGAEELRGNAGDNILVGFGGEDTMSGGGGADSFVLTGQRGTDPNVLITDWGRGADRLAIDDQLLGLGERGIDIRELTREVFRDVRDSGAVGYNFRTGELRLDIDGDGDRELVATLEGGARLGLDDVLLF